MIRRVRTLAIAIAAAAVVHAIATAVTRLFLFFVAPGWAAHVVGRALARGAGYVPPK